MYTQIDQKRVAKLIAEWAKTGASTMDIPGKMCKGCAFKLGTEANGDQIVFEAADCVAGMGGMFMCHELPQICQGFINACANNDEKPESKWNIPR